MPSGNALTIPDFVVVGGQYELDEGPEVILLASKNLKQIELTEILRNPERLYNRRYPYDIPQYDMYLTAQVRDYVMVRAKTYPEAWQALFQMWSPTPEPQREIQERKAIEL
jgi:hypothetical protein